MSTKIPPKIVAKNPKTYVLGLDLGVSSIGWAAVEIGTDRRGEPNRNAPTGILDMGVRRFDAGVSGSQEDIRKGKDESHATDRRNARASRRQTWRRKRRKQRVFRILMNNGLLPRISVEPQEITKTIQNLDRVLHAKFVSSGDRQGSNVLTYRLRALALKRELMPHELGRALYHLSQRRGFLSNRKAPMRDGEDEGVVKSAISALQESINDSGCETLGEYLSQIDSEGDKRTDEYKRIRGRWTARQMYLHEFDLIVERQREFHSILQDNEFVAILRDAIFDQRPLRSQASLIGTCDLVPGRRRAAVACIPYQRFRLLQKLNDLSYIDKDGEKKWLTEEQWDVLRGRLSKDGDLTWAQVRKTIGLGSKSKETGLPVFSHEEGGEKRLTGDRTTAKIRKVIPNEFDALNEREQTELVDDIRSYADEEKLAKRLRDRWEPMDDQAADVAAIQFEPGYGSLSRKAIAILTPKLLKRVPFATARLESPELNDTNKTACWPLLPPQGDNAKMWQENQRSDRLVYETFSNPTVARVLSEMRKVVNALIRRYGRPEYIRVELARDLKNSRGRRADLAKRRDRNQRVRADAKAAIEKECGNSQPSRSDVEKWLLAEECGFVCPYSGKPIPRSEVMTAEFEIEHIVPFSLSLDNSFVNKTISHRDWNQQKGNRTPKDAFGSTYDWEMMLSRVRRFNGPYGRRKLDLFQRDQPSEVSFLERQLNETRYLSRQATEYLALLYGGLVEKVDGAEVGRRRVLVTSGRATSLLRRGWELQAATGGDKNRKDHRHHAIDALIIALTQDGFLKALSNAAARANDMQLERLTTEIDPPWDGFIKDVRDAYENINVSCRPNRKLNGPLHKETIFSKPKSGRRESETKFFTVRRPLTAISKTEVPKIVDLRIRQIVTTHLEGHDGDLKAAFSDPSQHPMLPTNSGRLIPIHRVRVRRREQPRRIGKKSSARYVSPGANHHLQIIAQLDDHGNETRWVGRIVNRLDAMTKFAEWKSSSVSGTASPLSEPNTLENETLKYSIMPGDHLLINLGDEPNVLCRVNSISENKQGNTRLELQRHNDARSASELRNISGGRINSSPESMRRDQARKVDVSPLGEIVLCGR